MMPTPALSKSDKPEPFKPSPQRQLSAESLTPPAQTNAKIPVPAERRKSVSEAYIIGKESGPVVKATVTGTTHAVGFSMHARKLKNEDVEVATLFDGKELEISCGADRQIDIDPTHAIVSRRGPNQESSGFRRQDFKSDPEYTWYPIHSADPKKYKEQDWPYVRSNTLAEHETLIASVDNQRKRAAPTNEYEKIADLTVAKFIENQKTYQNKLLKSCSKEQILTSHRSVGFEYEFIGHSAKDLASHIKLAKSEPYSDLFKMSFELESDSGDVVEIVMPPFIVPNLPNGAPDQKEIHAITTKMEEALKSLAKEVVGNGEGSSGLREFVAKLNESGLGQGWELLDENKDTKGLKVQKSDTKKLAGGHIYSQMNISLDGDESARLINFIQKKVDPGTAESTIIGETYNALRAAVPAGVEDGPYTHLIKTMASSLAIPSILLQKDRVKLSIDDDLSSTVKELLGTWVKDSLPNILKTTPASKKDLAELKKFSEEVARPILSENFEKLKDSLKGYHPREEEREEWNALKREIERRYGEISTSTEKQKEINSEKYAAISNDSDFKECVKMSNWLGESVVGDIFKKGDVTVDGEHPEYGSMLKKYEEYTGKMTPLVDENINALDKDVIFNTIWNTFEKEVDNLIEKIDFPEVVTVEHTDFQNEKFLNGEVGVRKDTYILPDPKSIMSVVELRSNVIINAFKDAELRK